MLPDINEINMTLLVTHGREAFIITNGNNETEYATREDVLAAVEEQKIIGEHELVLQDKEHLRWLCIRIQGLKAFEKVAQIKQELADAGFTAPLVGEGLSHRALFYRLDSDAPANAEHMLAWVISILALHHSDEGAEVTQGVTIPLYGMPGTRLGEVPERINRDYLPYSVIEQFIKNSDLEMLEDDASTGFNANEFSLQKMLDEHLPEGIEYSVQNTEQGTSFLLSHCVFNEHHKEARFSVTAGGRLSYHCATCDKTYKEARKLINPTPEEKAAMGRKALLQMTNAELLEKGLFYVKPTEEEIDLEELDPWVDLDEDTEEEITYYIPTGYEELDASLGGGIAKGTVTLLLGGTGGGKTTFLTNICANAVENKYQTYVYSGELSRYEQKNWFMLQVAGPGHTFLSEADHKYHVTKEAQEAITAWGKPYYHRYRNDCGTDYRALIPRLDLLFQTQHPDLLIIDNFMSLEVGSDQSGQQQWNQQNAFSKYLHAVAKRYNVAIIMAIHPNSSGQRIIRRHNMQGAANITSWAETLLILHRVTEDFIAAAPTSPNGGGLGWEEEDSRLNADNLIEISKCRFPGATEQNWISLRYDRPSNRLLEMGGKQPHFSWLQYLPCPSQEEYEAAYRLIASGMHSGEEVAKAQKVMDRYILVNGSIR